jgi:putative membrane protein
VAVSISVLSPGAENDAVWYLFICGVVAMCSMILPGLSGSFVLILMGNYHLVMIEAVNELNLRILLPLAVGAGSGLIAFSHFLSWILKKFQDQTIALLTGFILGSLAMLWPWKNSFDADGRMIDVNRFGAFIDANGAILHDIKVFGYRQVLPGGFDGVVIGAMGLMILGIVAIWLMERSAGDGEAGTVSR